jgi:hypothetical protein
MGLWREVAMNPAIRGLADRFEKYGDTTLTYMIIGAAIVFVVMALTIHNPYIKAFILAYMVLP